MNSAEDVTSLMACIAEMVAAQLGPSVTEMMYVKAMAMELECRQFSVAVESPIPTYYTTSDGRRHFLASCRADMVVGNNFIVVEVKHGNMSKNLVRDAVNQVQHYAHSLNLISGTTKYWGVIIFPKENNAKPYVHFESLVKHESV